ncbi:MAG: ATP-dependent DNA helicase RecG [Desulfitobacteriaceae bacterium]|nr:ATP-dependent DNA helicase RecG [Desulfitobacteriaceae bacterium]
MLTRQQQVVLNNLRKVFLAEEKKGYGGSEGFADFLSGMIPRLEQLFPGVNFKRVRQIAHEYLAWGLTARRQGLTELICFLDKQLVSPGLSNQVEVEKQPGDLELQYIKGIGPQTFKKLQLAGLLTIEDLLRYYPRRYEDRRPIRITELREGENVTVTARVTAGQVSSGRIKVVKLTLEQEGSSVQAVWFNQPYILKQFLPGTLVKVTGKVRCFQLVPEIMVNDIEKLTDDKSSLNIPLTEIIPVYPETKGLSSKALRNIIKNLLQYAGDYFPEFLSAEDLSGWLERSLAYQEIHFPSSPANLRKARERLVWEEVVFLQLSVARRRLGSKRRKSPPLPGGGDLIKRFRQMLPFQLTSAQERIIREISQDLKSSTGMARLVQGDVGSGKTVIAMAALLQAVGSGYQGAMMAPTEILALQHYQSLGKMFEPLGVKVALLLGSQKRSEREANQCAVADGYAQVIVGTHALIQEKIRYKALGLVITDEQHRFGVRQRTLLQSKGENPHVLVLSATPIPRTLALTMYGDLQLSLLNELPLGRKPVLTRKLSERGRPQLERFLEKQMDSGRQIFVVCSLVEESEVMEVISATNHAIYLQERYPERRVTLIHGKMKGNEKETIMQDFLAHKIDILVATTVVEVGVNIPNATVMVVEGAERYGLAQIHQLRGRVGRGSKQSYCFLMTEQTSRRLDILCKTNDGFKIAEEDLRLRGPGEILGTRQHGLPELRLTNPLQDAGLIEKAFLMTQKVLHNPDSYLDLLYEVERSFSAQRIGLH